MWHGESAGLKYNAFHTPGLLHQACINTLTQRQYAAARCGDPPLFVQQCYMQQSVFMHVFSKPRAFRNCRLSDRLHHCVAAGQLQMRQIKRDESQVVGVCCLSNVWGKSGRIYCSIFTMAGFWKTARNEWKGGAAITNSPYHPEIPSSIPG